MNDMQRSDITAAAEHEKRVLTVMQALGNSRDDAEKIVAIADRRNSQRADCADILPAMIALLSQGDWRQTVRRWAEAWRDFGRERTP